MVIMTVEAIKKKLSHLILNHQPMIDSGRIGARELEAFIFAYMDVLYWIEDEELNEECECMLRSVTNIRALAAQLKDVDEGRVAEMTLEEFQAYPPGPATDSEVEAVLADRGTPIHGRQFE
jgi:hypothetical protein